MHYEQDYLNLLGRILHQGEDCASRAGETRSLLGQSLRIGCLTKGAFPLLTTRKIHYMPVFGELAAFLRGTDRLADFKQFGCNYWDENAKAWFKNTGLPLEKMFVGRIYGVQWRDWGPGGLDQLRQLVKSIRTNPKSRRHVVTAWAPDELDQMCLPPCHILFQCFVRRGRLHMTVYMRSVDVCLGLPSDIVLYAMLLILLAYEVGLAPGELIFMLGDAHVYKNHFEQARIQLERESDPPPPYQLMPMTGIDTFVPTDIKIHLYEPQGAINYAFNV